MLLHSMGVSAIVKIAGNRKSMLGIKLRFQLAKVSAIVAGLTDSKNNRSAPNTPTTTK